MLLQITTPVPKDIPLALPLPEWLGVSLLIISFLLHIVFIHLMVGGSILTFWAQIRGLKDGRFDVLAHEIAKTITVNKSLAVVLGVAPLLSINTLYTVYFYSANALTGFVWIMIIPLVTIAFLLTYLHKYSWNSMKRTKRIHISIIGAATLIFLFIPTIFLTNVNLMMFPEKWGLVKGYLSALALPNVFPRYLEFLAGCISITGVFLVAYNSRKNYPFDEIYQGEFSREEVKRIGYYFAVLGFAAQILFGLLVVFTLPPKGITFELIGLMLSAGFSLMAALWWSYQSLRIVTLRGDTHLKKIIISVVVFLVFYGGSRQLYRHNALHKHQQLMAEHTASFNELSKKAREEAKLNQVKKQDESANNPFAAGEAVFQQNCSACHQLDQKIVGPPIKEMVSIYSGNEAALKQWIKAPGKKRPDYPQMPGFAQLSDQELQDLSQYILSFK